MKENHSPKLINKLREIWQMLITRIKRFKSNQIKAKSAEAKIAKKGRNIPKKSSPIDYPNTHIEKSITTKELISKILSLLVEGKTEDAIKTFHLHRKNKITSESRFLNGLSHAEKNDRKSLWASSFHANVNTKTIYNQELIVQFAPFQYWSQGRPPSDIIHIQEIWNKIFLEIGLPAIKIFDKSSARDWINIFTPQLSKPFNEAPLYAVEADIFRIAFALHNDCIWIDCDQYPRQNTAQLIHQCRSYCDSLLMFRWNRPWVTNSFFLTRKASPFFQKITNTILSYKFPANGAMTRNDVLRSFGPGRYNLILNKIIRECSIQTSSNSNYLMNSGMTSQEGWRYAFLNEKNLCSLKPPFKLSYESSEDSWHNSVK